MSTAPNPPAPSRGTKISRFKKVGDGTLLVAAIMISAVALAACWFGGRAAETGILRYEAKSSARSWTVYLLDNLPHVANIMAGQGVTEEDRTVIAGAMRAGGVLRFKILGSDGRVVYASKQSDIGTVSTDPHFRATVQKGNLHSAISGVGPFGTEPQVVSEAFVPIIGGGKFLGAIKVYADVTARAHQIARIGFLSFLGLLGFILLIALVMTALVAKNFEGSLRAKRALATSRKRIESFQGQLVAAKESAEAVNQQRSGVLADVIHDMRSPIGGVIETAALLSESELTDRQRKWVGTITQSAGSVLNAIDNILDLSRIQTDRVEIERVEFDLAESMADVAAALAGPAAEKGLEFAYYVAPKLPDRVWGDPQRLHQVLFTMAGAAIGRTDRGEVVLRAITEGGTDRANVRFEVHDTGAAISSEDRALIFSAIDPTSDAEAQSGTELGLSICHHLIREMGGELAVESDPATGTRFHFALPFESSGDHGRPLRESVQLAGKRMLVVDDSAAARDIVIQHFADWSVEADAAGDGQGALDQMRDAVAQGRPYDIVIVDMTMPGMSGLDLAREVRKDTSLDKTGLVLLTSTNDPNEGIDASEPEISARLEKPIHARALLEKLVSVIVNAPAVQKPDDDTGQDAESAGAPDNDIAEKYLQHTRISLEKLRDAVASEKAGAVQMTADSLKSSSLDIGATGLAGLCRELESMARVGNLGGVQSMLDAIEEEYAKVCETLRAELSLDPGDPQAPSP